MKTVLFVSVADLIVPQGLSPAQGAGSSFSAAAVSVTGALARLSKDTVTCRPLPGISPRGIDPHAKEKDVWD